MLARTINDDQWEPIGACKHAPYGTRLGYDCPPGSNLETITTPRAIGNVSQIPYDPIYPTGEGSPWVAVALGAGFLLIPGAVLAGVSLTPKQIFILGVGAVALLALNAATTTAIIGTTSGVDTLAPSGLCDEVGTGVEAIFEEILLWFAKEKGTNYILEGVRRTNQRATKEQICAILAAMKAAARAAEDTSLVKDIEAAEKIAGCRRRGKMRDE